jgi:pyruvate formate lyase activating enzyme
MRCNYCERRCELGEGRLGVCKMYIEENGVIHERFPLRWCTCNISRVEAIPFYHAYPGSRSLVIGTTGCNFECRYCSNSYIAKDDPVKQQKDMFEYTPLQIIETAKKLNCHNIIFNVNEPTVSLPSLIRLGEVAQMHRIPMGCLTNAYMTEEATEMIASIFSFINVSLKGLSPEFLREYIGINSAEPVLRNIKRLARTNHVEVTVPVVQSLNDGELTGMADWLAGVDPDIPFHVFRLLPEYQMKDFDYPDIEQINTILDSVRKKLRYVYFHNFVGSDWVNTLCPECGSVVIERLSLGCGGDKLLKFSCFENKCPVCGREIKLLVNRAVEKASI